MDRGKIQNITHSKEFLKNRVNPILELMVLDLMKEKPEEVTEFMINWLKNKGRNIEIESRQALN